MESNLNFTLKIVTFLFRHIKSINTSSTSSQPDYHLKLKRQVLRRLHCGANVDACQVQVGCNGQWACDNGGHCHATHFSPEVPKVQCHRVDRDGRHNGQFPLMSVRVPTRRTFSRDTGVAG